MAVSAEDNQVKTVEEIRALADRDLIVYLKSLPPTECLRLVSDYEDLADRVHVFYSNQ